MRRTNLHVSQRPTRSGVLVPRGSTLREYPDNWLGIANGGIGANSHLGTATLACPECNSTAFHAHLKRPTATVLHLFRYTDKAMPVLKNIAAIAKGMSITFSEMFRPTIVENYPDGKDPLRGARIEARFRGAHVLQRDENGLEKCVACFLCAAACPSNCIYIEAAENKVYNIDYNRCIFCGYCVEACPTDAITHGHGFELATFNATNLVMRKEQMLAPRPAHMGANIVFNQADVNGGAPAEMVPGS
jgi:NADH-quinone oxidoreductase subunit I